jgi:hypothetical protein
VTVARISVIILGRESDVKFSEFILKFSLGRLRDKGESSEVLASIGKLGVAKAGLVLNKGSPRDRDCDRFSSHKVC